MVKVGERLRTILLIDPSEMDLATPPLTTGARCRYVRQAFSNMAADRMKRSVDLSVILGIKNRNINNPHQLSLVKLGRST